MRKRSCLYIAALLLFLLASCNGAVKIEDDYSEMPTDKVTQPNLPMIISWNPCEGEFEYTEKENLLPFTNVSSKNNMVNYGDTKYIKMDLPMDMFELPLTSGWRIQLNELSPVARTNSGDIIFISSCDNSPILCIYDKVSGAVQCYLRSDIEEHGICSLELDDFDIYVDGCFIPKDEKIDLIWKMHTGNEKYSTGYLPLDGDWKYYSLRLTYKDCPALQYELNFVLIDGLLYIDNLPSGERKYIPVNQIIGPGH